MAANSVGDQTSNHARETSRAGVAVIGASAGGVEAMSSVVRNMPADLPLAVVVVLHMPTGARSRLPEILGRAGPLPAAAVRHGQALQAGRIHVAPPDRHVVVSADRLHLLDGPRENGFRPAIDPLFRSAAQSLGPRAIGVILSGTMDDGVTGLAAIQAMGGSVIVQDPADAMCGALPEAALEALEADHVVPASSIGPLLATIASGATRPAHRVPTPLAEQLVADPLSLEASGVDLSCPDCGGALQEVRLGDLRRYRCRVGHVLSPESLLDGQGEALESALWTAVRTLEETATLSRRLADRSRGSGAVAAARRFEARQVDAARRADLVRQAIGALGQSLNETTEDALAAVTENRAAAAS